MSVIVSRSSIFVWSALYRVVQSGVTRRCRERGGARRVYCHPERRSGALETQDTVPAGTVYVIQHTTVVVTRFHRLDVPRLLRLPSSIGHVGCDEIGRDVGSTAVDIAGHRGSACPDRHCDLHHRLI